MWLRHDGAATGVATNVSGSWQGPREVDRDWGQYKQIFAGDNGDIYTIKNDGILQLHQHSGFQTGLGESEGGRQPARSLSKGWGNFKQAFSGGGGMLYAITNDGVLRWYKHGVAGGKATWEGPSEIDTRWQNYKQVFSGGHGVIYALNPNGKLYWYRHIGYATGAKTWDGPKEVGSNWTAFEQVACAGDGLFYAVKPTGELMWYRQYGHDAGFKNWMPEKSVGGGWNNLPQVFAMLSTRSVASPPLPGSCSGSSSSTGMDSTGASDSVGQDVIPMKVVERPFISDLIVVPDTRDVRVSFTSSQRGPALLEISKVKPKTDRNGVLTFPFDSGAFSRFVTVNNGRYDVNLDALGAPLEIDSTYYYILNVFNDNKSASKQREQASGIFTTLPQTVKVTWHKIFLTDDSDDLSDGELQFWSWANYGQPGAKFEDYSKDGFGSEHFNYPDKVVVLEHAPGTSTLSASGRDDDNIGTTLFSPYEPLKGFTSNDKEDSNIATGTFNLMRYPGNNVSVPFQLNSMPGGALKFVVYGTIEITRPGN